jgi:hypothetical protein
MVNDDHDVDDIDENEQACLMLYYWPALDRFNEALIRYNHEVNTNGPLEDNHPVIIELNAAHDNWAEELHHWDFVKKMCRNYDAPK